MRRLVSRPSPLLSPLLHRRQAKARRLETKQGKSWLFSHGKDVLELMIVQSRSTIIRDNHRLWNWRRSNGHDHRVGLDCHSAGDYDHDAADRLWHTDGLGRSGIQRCCYRIVCRWGRILCTRWHLQESICNLCGGSINDHDHDDNLAPQRCPCYKCCTSRQCRYYECRTCRQCCYHVFSR